MDYTYSVARIKPMKVVCLCDTIQALLNLETYDQCMTFLRDKGWGDGHLDETLEHMLNEES